MTWKHRQTGLLGQRAAGDPADAGGETLRAERQTAEGAEMGKRLRRTRRWGKPACGWPCGPGPTTPRCWTKQLSPRAHGAANPDKRPTIKRPRPSFPSWDQETPAQPRGRTSLRNFWRVGRPAKAKGPPGWTSSLSHLGMKAPAQGGGGVRIPGWSPATPWSTICSPTGISTPI